MHGCRLDIVWEEDNGRKIVESRNKSCCTSPGERSGFRKTYSASHVWSDNWKARADFHWKGGPESEGNVVRSPPISSGEEETTPAFRPAVRVKLT